MDKPASSDSLLSWQASAALLALACIPVAWLSLAVTARGWPQEDVAPWALALALLVGSRPFFMRRVFGFTLGGLAAVVGAGLALAALGAVGMQESIGGVFCAWIGMFGALRMVARPTALGRMMELGKAPYLFWIETPAERYEWVLKWLDHGIVLMLILALMALWLVWDLWTAVAPSGYL